MKQNINYQLKNKEVYQILTIAIQENEHEVSIIFVYMFGNMTRYRTT